MSNSDSGGGLPAVQDWDSCVSAAYLRSLGVTQREAANAVGFSERSIRAWEHSTWWPKAVDEATDRWLGGVRAAARERLSQALRDVDTDPWLALKILERLEPALHPKASLDVHGVGGQSVNVNVTRRIVRPMTDEERAEKITALLDRARQRRERESG